MVEKEREMGIKERERWTSNDIPLLWIRRFVVIERKTVVTNGANRLLLKRREKNCGKWKLKHCVHVVKLLLSSLFLPSVEAKRSEAINYQIKKNLLTNRKFRWRKNYTFIPLMYNVESSTFRISISISS